MKKFLLILIFSVAFNFGKSQNLANTIWFGTNPPSINLYFLFGSDTLYFSTGSGYTPLSLYIATGGQFYISDLTGTTACMDTGYYNYSIGGNNLVFSFISDNCVSRKNTLVNYNWTLIGTTGVHGLPGNSEVAIFPNPANDGIFNLSVPAIYPGVNEFTVYDLNGKKVYYNNITETISLIDMSSFPCGIYIGYYHSDAGVRQFKMVR